MKYVEPAVKNTSVVEAPPGSQQAGLAVSSPIEQFVKRFQGSAKEYTQAALEFAKLDPLARERAIPLCNDLKPWEQARILTAVGTPAATAKLVELFRSVTPSLLVDDGVYTKRATKSDGVWTTYIGNDDDLAKAIVLMPNGLESAKEFLDEAEFERLLIVGLDRPLEPKTRTELAEFLRESASQRVVGGLLAALRTGIENNRSSDYRNWLVDVLIHLGEVAQPRVRRVVDGDSAQDATSVRLRLALSVVANEGMPQPAESAGKEHTVTPDAIIEAGRSMSPEEAIPFFEKHQHSVAAWPKENQGGFYYFLARKVERLTGTEAAKPYFAAGLVANPVPNAAGWGAFGSVPKTRDSAVALAKRYPLP